MAGAALSTTANITANIINFFKLITSSFSWSMATSDHRTDNSSGTGRLSLATGRKTD